MRQPEHSEVGYPRPKELRGLIPTGESAGTDPVRNFLDEFPDGGPILEEMELAFREYVARTPSSQKLSALDALVHADEALDWMRFLSVRADRIAAVATAKLAPLGLTRPGMLQVLGVTPNVVYKAFHLIQRHYGADAKARIRFRQLRDPSRDLMVDRNPAVASGAAEFRAWVARFGPNPAEWQPEPGAAERPLHDLATPAQSGAQIGPVCRTEAVPSIPATSGHDPGVAAVDAIPSEEFSSRESLADVGSVATHTDRKNAQSQQPSEAPPPTIFEAGRDLGTIRKTGKSRFQNVG